MKKTIISLLSLFLLAGAFAETGFNGFQWGAEKSEVVIPNNPEYAYTSFYGPYKKEDYAIADTVNYSASLFGGGIVFYHFHNGFNLRKDNKPGLYAVSASVSKYDIDYIKKEYEEKKYFETEYATTTLAKLKSEGEQLGEGVFYDYYMNHSLAMSSLAGFLSVAGMGYSWKGNGRIAVFDYNDDSVLCTLENVIEGTTILMLIQKRLVIKGK